VSLVEECLLRPWPGNVRELLVEVRTAAQARLRDGNRVEARDLAATAGMLFGAPAPEERAVAPGSLPPAAPTETTPTETTPTETTREDRRKPMQRDDLEWRGRIEDALRANAGNVAATARALGLHRTQLRRLIARTGITADAFTDPDDDDAT
jgi:transcriptional regulator with GAF, ATPase, and Fis domain